MTPEEYNEALEDHVAKYRYAGMMQAAVNAIEGARPPRDPKLYDLWKKALDSAREAAQGMWNDAIKETPWRKESPERRQS